MFFYTCPIANPAEIKAENSIFKISQNVQDIDEKYILKKGCTFKILSSYAENLHSHVIGVEKANGVKMTMHT